MPNFRNPEYLQRHEDVIFDLDSALVAKVGYRFVVNNSGEVTSFDWYNARFSVNFKVNKLAD